MVQVKGVEVIRNIKDNERGGRATIIVVGNKFFSATSLCFVDSCL
jgi:hypothetical protein